MRELGKRAKQAEFLLGASTAQVRNAALLLMADALVANADAIVSANQLDLQAGKAAGLTDGLLDRLMLNHSRITAMAEGTRMVANLPDPLGKVLNTVNRPNGLLIKKVSVPLGVVGMIYEARPNVTADTAALCLKSGNAVILRGGKEAIHSNNAIATIIRQSIEKADLPADCVQLVQDVSRGSANEMMKLNEFIDVLIPRGGAGLIRSVVENSTVPIIETGTGNCHIYVDKDATLEMAVNIIFNAKTTRISVCNSCESLVVHSEVAQTVLPMIAKKLSEKKVELRGDAHACEILPTCKLATDADFATEYLDYILSIKIVDSLEEAIAHINTYSTGHSDAIITNKEAVAQQFLTFVDSAAVYVNASTRFTDGGEFGEGAEIGISTQKLHARGPMGLDQLTSTKFLIYGTGQVRE